MEEEAIVSSSPSLSSSSTQPQQIPLISYIDGKFQVDKRSALMISKIKEPVAVLSIAGVYRSGKSFLLNQILDRNDGFTTSPSHLPCTKGLWVWSVPMKMSNENHPDFRLLIVDSEGIGSFSANETYDTQVFSLALLMSSMFIYNSQGSIDDNAITRLGLVTELSKYIKSKLGGLDNHSIFPSFLWVVRDFSLDLQITPKNYLEFALSSEDRTYSESEKNKQQIKGSLKQYFRDRDCFTLVRPIHDERKLQNASKLDSFEIRPEFRNQIEKLKQKIFDTVSPKELGGRMLNGRMFISLCENYCNAINDGSILVDSCWSNVVKTECDAVHSESIKIYKTKMQKLLKQNVDQNELENAHFESESEALSYFLENSKYVVRDVQFHVGQLQDSMIQIFKLLREEVRSLNYDFNSKLLSSSFSQISTYVENLKSIDERNYKFRECLENYKEKAKGDKNSLVIEVMANWIFETLPHYHKTIMDQLLNEKNQEQEQTTRIFEDRIRSLQEQSNSEIAQLSDSKSKMKDQMLNLHNAIKKLKKDLTSQETISKEQSDKIQSTKLDNSKLLQDIKVLKNELEHAYQETKEQKEKLGDQIHTERLENDALKEENINLQKTVTLLQENKAELQRNISDLQELIARLKDSYNKVRIQNSNTEETLKQTTEVLETSYERKKQLEETMRKAQEQVSYLSNEVETQKENVRRLEREVSTKNAKIKSSERMMILEKEKAADSEDRLRQTLKNTAQLSSSERIKDLEEQVEHLNTTNRRILEINKTVMEENKGLKDKMREKKVESRTSIEFRSTPEKISTTTASNPSTPSTDASNSNKSSGTPIMSSEGREKAASVRTAVQTKTPEMMQNPYDTPRSISDISPISTFVPNSTNESEDSLDTSTSSNNDPAAFNSMSEKSTLGEGKKIRKTIKRKNSPIKQTRAPSSVVIEQLNDSVNMRRLTRRQSFGGGSPKEKVIDTIN